MKCRSCGTEISQAFADLGYQPIANSFVSIDQLDEQSEKYYPLKALYCHKCHLVQLGNSVAPEEIFDGGYIYRSSTSQSWVDHAREYVEMINKRLKLDTYYSRVLEIGSNDGYMLQWFKELGITAVGIDPAKGAVDEANEKGFKTYLGRFDKNLAMLLPKYDLICGINVLAHQDDINDFVAGLRECLAHDGTITFEFPSLKSMVENNMFDTIYHEHYMYFSLFSVMFLFNQHGLVIYDVERLDTHGGSYRIYVCHEDQFTANLHINNIERLNSVMLDEVEDGMNKENWYLGFQDKMRRAADDFMAWINSVPRDKTVAGYGAAAKANTFINYCGTGLPNMLCVFDKAKDKVGLCLPGSHIPIYGTDMIDKVSPDYIVIFAWNFKDEIIKEFGHIREWGGKFVVALPELEVIE